VHSHVQFGQSQQQLSHPGTRTSGNEFALTTLDDLRWRFIVEGFDDRTLARNPALASFHELLERRRYRVKADRRKASTG
jgi:hypothetical protein